MHSLDINCFDLFEFVLYSVTHDTLVLVQVMAWVQADNKPLPEPVMTHSIDEYVHHLTSMSKLIGHWEMWL